MVTNFVDTANQNPVTIGATYEGKQWPNVPMLEDHNTAEMLRVVLESLGVLSNTSWQAKGTLEPSSF
jgi:hypothetical protein